MSLEKHKQQGKEEEKKIKKRSDTRSSLTQKKEVIKIHSRTPDFTATNEQIVG